MRTPCRRVPGQMVPDWRLSRRSMVRAGGAGLAMIGLAGQQTGTAQDGTLPGASPVDTVPFPLEDQAAFEAVVTASLAETGIPGALVGIRYRGRGDWVRARRTDAVFQEQLHPARPDPDTRPDRAHIGTIVRCLFDRPGTLRRCSPGRGQGEASLRFPGRPGFRGSRRTSPGESPTSTAGPRRHRVRFRGPKAALRPGSGRR